MKKFEITYGKGQQQNTCELKVRSWVNEAVVFCDNLLEVKNYITSYINGSLRINHLYLSQIYSIVLADDYKTLWLWHNNIQGDRDRLVLTVKMV